MPLFMRLRHFWLHIVDRRREDAELGEELQAYVDLLTAEKTRAGMSPVDARRAALIEMGGTTQVAERVRDVRVGAWLDSVAQDLRYAVRALARAPGFTAAAVAALALGIGANSAILSVVDGVLLRPLPYAHPERLVVILHGGANPVAPANYLDWKRDARAFDAMGAAQTWTTNLSGIDQPEKVSAIKMTADILPMLGVAPLLGHTWTADDDRMGRQQQVAIGYGLWMRDFGGDPRILQRSIALDGESYRVIGVMPADFAFAPFWATHAEMWAPFPMQGQADNRTSQSLRIFARLAPGASIEQARSEITAITARLDERFPGTNRDVRVTGLTERVVGNVRTPLLVLLGAVGFVLLIACANVAHMLLARATARRREIAVRAAIGASRGRLMRQLLTESLLLAALGAAAGLLLARVGVRALMMLGATSVPRVLGVSLDLRVVAATVVLAAATGVLFGLAPALHASATDLTGSLKDGARGSAAGGRGRKPGIRGALIASEFALAVMLLVGAGLLVRSFITLQALDPGFAPRGLLTMTLSIGGTSEGAPGRAAAYYQAVVDRLRAIPGVESVGAINHLPLGGESWGWTFRVEGRPIARPGESPGATYRVVLPGYFRTMGIPILEGRDVEATDRLGATNVVVVNEYLARKHWPGENAIGRRMTFDDDSLGHPVWVTVIGVVKNTMREDWDAQRHEEIFLPWLQSSRYMDARTPASSYLSFAIRTSCTAARCAPAAYAAPVRAAVRALDPAVTVSEVQTMDQMIAAATARPRFYLVLLATFAGVALLLAAVGIYGVMSYAVSRRTHEIGLRVALGARPAQLLRQVIGEGMTVVAWGAAGGVAGALALSRIMNTLLYDVRPTDPLTFIGVVALLAIAALIACYIPARRATRVDPLSALRSD